MKPRVIQLALGDDPPTARLYYGQTVLETLRELPDNSVHMVCTSPPYWGLRDYGVPPQAWPAFEYAPMTGTPSLEIGEQSVALGLESAPSHYVGHMVLVFREVRRVLRDDGIVWLNLGDSYAGYHGNSKVPDDEAPSNKPGYVENMRESTVGVGGLKSKDMAGIPWRVALALQADGWVLRNDIIWAKCLSGGTRVYARTQKGEMPTTIKDLVRLDPLTVELWNGERWSKVRGWVETPRPSNPVEIVLRSGECVGCTPDHRWPTERGLLRADELRKGDILLKTPLPEPETPRRPIHLPDEDIGWIVGLYIAEGSRDKWHLHFASHRKETERFERLARIAEMFDGSASVTYGEGQKADALVVGSVLYGIIDRYVSGTGAHTKHLHSRCWGRTNSFLRAILEGYLSGDGHHDKPNGRWRLAFCKNDNLANDLRTLAARLGLSLRLKRAMHTFDGRKYPGWRGQLRFDRSGHWNEKEDTEVMEIRRGRARKFWDIEVEDAPHLFALASGVLTHNSSCMPEPVKDRCTRSHEYVFMFSQGPRYFYDAEAIKEKLLHPGHKGSRYGGDKQHVKHRPTAPDHWSYSGRMYDASELTGRNKRTVWNINPRPYPGAHFAVWPPELVEPMVKASTSDRGVCGECGAPYRRIVEKGDVLSTVGWEATCECGAPRGRAVVMDIFSGSGTTGMVALELGRDYLGIDLQSDYIKLAEARVRGERAPQPPEDDEEGDIFDFFGGDDA